MLKTKDRYGFAAQQRRNADYKKLKKISNVGKAFAACELPQLSCTGFFDGPNETFYGPSTDTLGPCPVASATAASAVPGVAKTGLIISGSLMSGSWMMLRWSERWQIWCSDTISWSYGLLGVSEEKGFKLVRCTTRQSLL